MVWAVVAPASSTDAPGRAVYVGAAVGMGWLDCVADDAIGVALSVRPQPASCTAKSAARQRQPTKIVHGETSYPPWRNQRP